MLSLNLKISKKLRLFFLADDEVNKSTTGYVRNLIERYFLRLKCKKFIRFASTNDKNLDLRQKRS